ncbi:MAG: DinB family protein [Bacteroidota bacterium]
MHQKLKLIIFIFMLTFACLQEAKAQYAIKPPRGYSPKIGTMVYMLDDLKSRLTRLVKDLDAKQTDFLLDENANRIGAMIMHLAATEKYYQLLTLEDRRFNDEEGEIWELPLTLGERARKEIQGKPMSHYLSIWDEVRKDTKRLLKERDDDWFDANVGVTSMSNHWAWYHVMEHEANHMGQILVIISRIE